MSEPERLVGNFPVGSWDAAGEKYFLFQNGWDAAGEKYFLFENGSNPDVVRYTLNSNLLLHFVALLQNMNFIAYIFSDTE